MNRWLRLLPMLIAALWLPFQAVAANAMPMCRHGQAPQSAPLAQATDAADHCHLHHDAAAQPETAVPDPGLARDDCGFCHLAGAGYMPVAERVAVVLPTDRRFALPPAVVPASHIPEPPQHPPRRRA